jgi:hypothetical protein
MRTSVQIFLLAVLVLNFPLPTSGKAKFLVTKEVLAEYVEDRLGQLEGREKLDEQQAAELNFIRQNADNLQALADFYGMKIKEETVVKISVPKEPSASKRESEREISQSHPTSRDTVEWERKRMLVVKAVPMKSSEPGEKSVGLTLNAEISEAKSAEKEEEKIAQKGMVAVERAISSIDTPSPQAKPEKAITAQKSAPQADRLTHSDEPQPTGAFKEYDAPNDLKDESISVAHLPIDSNSLKPSPAIMEEEVKQFLELYETRYTRKDIDGFLSLFSAKAVQNGRDGFNEIRKIYSDFFDQSQELRYYLTDAKIKIYHEVLIFGLFYESAALVEARYQVDQILNKKGKKKVWAGDARWILVREDGAPKILCLDFRPEKARAGETPKGGFHEGPDPMTHF